MFYLTTHSTHFIYGYMASDIWLRTILIVRKETRCRHIGYSFRLTARVLLYAPSHRQDNTYHGLCYTSRGALAEREIAQWVRSDDPSHHERKLLPRSYISLPFIQGASFCLIVTHLCGIKSSIQLLVVLTINPAIMFASLLTNILSQLKMFIQFCKPSKSAWL